MLPPMSSGGRASSSERTPLTAIEGAGGGAHLLVDVVVGLHGVAGQVRVAVAQAVGEEQGGDGQGDEDAAAEDFGPALEGLGQAHAGEQADGGDGAQDGRVAAGEAQRGEQGGASPAGAQGVERGHGSAVVRPHRVEQALAETDGECEEDGRHCGAP